MVRTKADNTARKAVAAKAPRKSLGGASSSSASFSSPSADKYGGGNSVCLRPVPDWQKKIDKFFIKLPTSSENEKEDAENTEEVDQGSSAKSTSSSQNSGTSSRSNSSSPSPKRRRPVIESDEED